MLATLFLMFGALCLTLLIYPYAIYPLVLRHLARKGRGASLPAPSRDRASTAPARVAVAVCAYNEERWIVAKAENLREMQRRHPGLEVLIYSDGSDDETVSRLAPFAEHFQVIAEPRRMGKSHGMNRLVQATTADAIIFSDCNVIVEPDAPARVLEGFGDPRVGCISGQLVYVNEGENATTAVGGLYWRLEEWIKAKETETGSAMGADGSLFAVRRALYPPVPADIIDDMYVSLSILCDGYRVVSMPALRAFEQTASGWGDEMRRKTRIACQAFNCHRLLWPRLRRLGAMERFQYVSHKLLRWFGLYFALAGLVFTVSGLALAGWMLAAFALLLASGVALALGLAFPIRYLAEASRTASFIAATGYGVVLSFVGYRFRTWTPPQSAR